MGLVKSPSSVARYALWSADVGTLAKVPLPIRPHSKHAARYLFCLILSIRLLFSHISKAFRSNPTDIYLSPLRGCLLVVRLCMQATKVGYWLSCCSCDYPDNYLMGVHVSIGWRILLSDCVSSTNFLGIT
jgi:hypothetical protein